MIPQSKTGWAAGITALLLLPLLLQAGGTHWVRSVDTCLLYLMLALGMNVVVGYAGLLDLGYVAFYAVGAYLFALLNSPHLSENFAAIGAIFPAGLHTPWWLTIPLAALLAAVLGMVLGAPTLKLRGDYLAIVTLGFGEVVRILINNMGGAPINITNGAQGVGPIDSMTIPGLDLGKPLSVGGFFLAPVTLHYYLFLALTVLMVIVCHRLEHSRIGRAWMAIRDDEVAAEAMGIHTRNLKLLAFGIGASFGGVAGAMFAAFQGFVSPEAFTLQESTFIVAMVVFGGLGHLPGVVLGAVLLTALPELLRYVAGPLQAMTDGRLDAGVLRPTLIALAMIATMLLRPRGLWPVPEHGSAPPRLADNALPRRVVPCPAESCHCDGPQWG
ncbi:MAG TPA: ABC transporter ATP-binding protein [Ideonella sp.]|uniref:branched-chain amino acid ABC transporter permease n=1 Tax=Ideonella sp. TaxID=1929293 RepID=UPI002E2FF4A4|nr:ABC transporter ATP-binding protein [Ideonella sp.]HEX5684550.1 ABC transporter ATP-binding protein [Ideonella sp.]